MNEKIEQFATDAGLQCGKDEAICFAEMIINECADYANWYQANSRYTDIAKAIREHFGVKQ